MQPTEVSPPSETVTMLRGMATGDAKNITLEKQFIGKDIIARKVQYKVVRTRELDTHNNFFFGVESRASLK